MNVVPRIRNPTHVIHENSIHCKQLFQNVKLNVGIATVHQIAKALTVIHRLRHAQCVVVVVAVVIVVGATEAVAVHRRRCVAQQWRNRAVGRHRCDALWRSRGMPDKSIRSPQTRHSDDALEFEDSTSSGRDDATRPIAGNDDDVWSCY